MNNIINRADKVIAKTYNRFPIVITKGKGCTVWDSEGRAYTDFVAGIAVCNLGHAHPEVSKALSDQANTLFHVSNLYYTVPQVELASWLVDNSFADRVFFCNSGAEANEAAIKLARKYFNDKGNPQRNRMIAAEKSFHGRTMATLSATGQARIKQGFNPLLGGFDFVPFNDIDALKNKIEPFTCAVIIEPVQGEGGVRCPDAEYLKDVRRLCDETGALLIFDEIQTGMGRTGKLFAYEHFGIEPDIMTLAKALANGLPIGAMLAREHIAAAFGPGSQQIGAYFKERLLWLKDRHDSIADVRGIGLLLGIKLKTEGAPVVKKCMEKGFLINCIQGNILRFIPPLIIEKEEIDSLITCLDEIL
jgi:acetylornithine aminotransferase